MLAAVMGLAVNAPLLGGADFAAREVLVRSDKVGLSPSYGSVIELQDGRLLWAWGRGGKAKPENFGTLSRDGGRTWSDPVALMLADGRPMQRPFAASLVRLHSGALGLLAGGESRFFFHVSRDEGKTWSQTGEMHSPVVDVAFTNDRAVVLADGRIIIPVYTRLQGPKLAVRKPRVRVHGEEFDTGWAHWMMYGYVCYSDDEGKTWQRSDNEVFVTRHLGLEGIYSAQEPAVAELADGRLLMLVRTNLGRLYRSHSTDRGKTWLAAEPTPLVGPAAAVSLRRIPGTGDVLAIWNQVSSFEEMQGLYRHRLSCATSSDGGVNWRNFKNLESLDDTAQIVEEGSKVVLMGAVRQPLDRKRYHRAPAPLRASYPTCTFTADGNAVITYGFSTLGEADTISRTYGMDYDEVVRKLDMGPEARANKVRVLPKDWFTQK